MKFAEQVDYQDDVVALNPEAEVFLALASQIRGAAVGWSPSAVSLLSDGLQNRFGELMGSNSEQAASSLIELATTPVAA